MTEYTTSITDLSGNQIGINPNSLRYSRNLNRFNEGSFKLSGIDTLTRQSITEGAIVTITKNGVLDFEGIIDNKTQFPGGIMAVHFVGSEFQMSKENTFSTKLFNNVASATIFASLIGNSTKWTSGTIETGVNVDFRVQDSDGVWNTTGNLINKTGQDISLDYASKEISILDHQGSQTSVVALIYEHNIRNMTYRTSYPVGNKVKVYGKGDGNNQIVSDPANGQDASSQSTYGIIPYPVRDPTVISIDESNKLADTVVGYTALPQKVYTFDVEDITLSTKVVEGDVVTIDAPEYDLSEEEVRIVTIERGFESDKEILVFQVTNKEYSKAQKKRNEIIGQVDKTSKDSQTYMQGSGNVITYGNIINANSTAPLVVNFALTDDLIKDEAGNIRVESFKFDYDIDPFRKGAGTANYDGGDAAVQGLSGDSQQDTELDAFDKTVSGGGNSGTDLTLGFVTGDTDFTVFTAYISRNRDDPDSNEGAFNVVVSNNDTSDIYLSETNILEEGPSWIRTFIIAGDIEGDEINMSVTDNQSGTGAGLDYSYGLSVSQIAEHDHGAGTYEIPEATLDSITIGDDVSDAAGVDSTGISWELQFYNGSTWVNKVTGSETFPVGQTFNTDIDLSSGGTLPDSSGNWRLRLFPNTSTSSDLAKANINVKHNLDN